MGKSGREKKPKPVAENENGTDTESSESIEYRLRRIELAHTRSSSDVYKFAFFFFMGMALTVIIYPGILNTIESLNNNNGDIGEHRQVTNDKFEPVMDVEQETQEEKKAEIKRSVHASDGENKTKLKVNKPRQEDSLIGEPEETNTEEIVHTEIDLDEQNDYTDIEEEEVDDISASPDVTKTRESVPLTLTPMSPDSDTVSVEIDPQRMNLSPEEPDTKQEIKQKVVPKEKPKPKEKKSAKKKETKKTTPKQKKSALKKDDDEKKPKIPKEVQDFKATYLKTTKPKKVFIDGRRIPPMELLPQKTNNSSVKVWMFEEFLSDAECDGLMRVHKQHVEDLSKENPIVCFDSVTTLRKHLKNVGKSHVLVTPGDFTSGTTCVNSSFSSQLKEWFQGNWSYSTAFYPGESRFASVFEDRVEQAMGLMKQNGGKFQITSYPSGIGYKSHTDCTEDSEDKRDRVATILVYLQTVDEGGETDFPELGIWARPRKGRALMWNNMDEDGNCEPLSVHQANKVVKGHKYILQRWYYYKSFYSLGKRPPEPPLPARNSGQMRVSCDEYEHGSCRWYDEWNFEHLIEYEPNKYTLV